jgi:hypothetical protein
MLLYPPTRSSPHRKLAGITIIYVSVTTCTAAARDEIRWIRPTFYIDKEIDKELKSIRGGVETFLKNPKPPIWVPPDYVTPSNREFITSLQIPSYCNGNPSLLLHDLDVCDDNEIKRYLDVMHPCM